MKISNAVAAIGSFSVFLLALRADAFVVAPTKAVVKDYTTTKLGALSFWNKPQKPQVPQLISGVGSDGCQLPSPSKINTFPKPVQAKIFVGIFAALFLGTDAVSSVLGGLTANYEWLQEFRYTWPLGLGLIYLAAGITHFTVENEYCNIYPSKGTWGLWYLPGSPEFHVRWTGVAEILGGASLSAGGIIDKFFPVYYNSPNIISSAGLMPDSAALLFLLTVAVTPANIYMYTHGARLPMNGPPVPLGFHAVRGAFQAVVLALLYQLGAPTFEAILAASK